MAWHFQRKIKSPEQLATEGVMEMRIRGFHGQLNRRQIAAQLGCDYWAVVQFLLSHRDIPVAEHVRGPRRLRKVRVPSN